MGKNKYISTPEMMLDLFEEYKTKTKENPRIENVLSNRTGEIIKVPREVPLTMEGFELYVFHKGLNTELSHYFSNKDKRYTDYVAVCSHVRKEIRNDQITGGMVNLYNASITQRLNGLVDKQETNVKVEQPLFGDE